MKLVSYSPDENWHLHDALSQLRNIVQRSRISGLSFRYSRMVLDAIFGEGCDRPKYIYPLDSPWPLAASSLEVAALHTPQSMRSNTPFISGWFGTPSPRAFSESGKFDTAQQKTPQNRGIRSFSLKTTPSVDTNCAPRSNYVQSSVVSGIRRHGLPLESYIIREPDGQTTHQYSALEMKNQSLGPDASKSLLTMRLKGSELTEVEKGMKIYDKNASSQ